MDPFCRSKLGQLRYRRRQLSPGHLRIRGIHMTKAYTIYHNLFSPEKRGISSDFGTLEHFLKKSLVNQESALTNFKGTISAQFYTFTDFFKSSRILKSLKISQGRFRPTQSRKILFIGFRKKAR